MQNITGKQTALDDDAEIYKRGAERADNKTEKQTWSELSAKGKWSYFCTYYLARILLVLAVLALVGYFLYSVLKPKPKDVAYIVVLDNTLDAVALQEFFDDAVVEMGYEKGKAEIFCDTRLSGSQNSLTDMSTLSTYIVAGTLDILIADEKGLRRYAENSMLVDLETLPDDIKAAIPEEDRYIYHFVPNNDSPKDAVERDIFLGIRLDNTELIQNVKFTTRETDYILTLIPTGDGVKNGNAYGVIRAILGIPQVK